MTAGRRREAVAENGSKCWVEGTVSWKMLNQSRRHHDQSVYHYGLCYSDRKYDAIILIGMPSLGEAIDYAKAEYVKLQRELVQPVGVYVYHYTRWPRFRVEWRKGTVPPRPGEEMGTVA